MVWGSGRAIPEVVLVGGRGCQTDFANLKSRDYLVVVDLAEQVRELSPDLPAPGRLTLRPMTESSRRVMLSCTCLTPLLRSGGILFAQAVLAIRSGAENLR